MNFDVEEYYCSVRNSYGFKVLLHTSNELPKISQYGISIGKGFETFISATPLLSQSSEGIRHIPINSRKCLFEEENYLSLFR